MNKDSVKLISVIIPCFNEEETVKFFYNEFFKRTQKIRDSGYNFEMIFVNDGSSDNTLNEIKKYKNVKYVSFSRNYGKEAAILAGLKEATGDLVTLMDVDLQDPPELLIKMLQAIEKEGYDCAAAYRKSRKGESPVRSWFANQFYKISNKNSDIKIKNGARDFRLMKKHVVDAILLLNEKNRFSKGIFAWVGFKTKWIGYENIDRVCGTTKWSFKKLFNYAIEGFVGYSDFLFGLPIILSVISFLCAVICAVLMFLNWKVFLILTVLLALSGLIFATFWIFGQYIKRIDKEVRNRPLYIVKERGNTDDK